ncbi:MAG: TolC family protein [Deltaproteobacteria bacterium]|nr:TolC family protein [Deltaproteobacteria bacterium]
MRASNRGVSHAALVLVGVLAGATAGRAQMVPGVTLPGDDFGDQGQSFGSEGATAPGAAPASATPRATGEASGLMGLAEPATREVLTLEAVLAAANQGAADAKVAVERVVQQEATLRRAWAAVLPTLGVGASYSLTCLGSGAAGLSCEDRTASFTDPDAAERQAQLFEGLASTLELGAQVEPDPQKQQDLLDQAAELRASAAQIREQAANAKPLVVQPANVLSATVALNVPLFNGRAFPLLFNAIDAVDVAKQAQGQVRVALRYAATRGYFGALTARKLVGIAERQVESAGKHVEATRARVEAATQPPLALRRAELDVLRAKQQATSARAAYDGAVAALGLVMGREQAFDVTDAPALPAPPGNDEATLIEAALAARTDVAAQRLSLQIAGRGELDAWMMFLPSINLSASARGTSFTSGFVDEPVTGALAVSAQLPLYDGGVRYAALKDGASRTREARIRLVELEDRVKAQVRGNLRELRDREASLGLSREAAAVAALAHEQAQAMFDAGVGTALDVSDTALAQFVADNELARAELELQLARAGLSYVLGQ